MVAVALIGWPAATTALVETALAGEGHQVVRVPLDADTVRTLGRQPPDVLVTDLHPYVDVHALLRDLRAQPELQGVPIVLVGPSEPIEVPAVEVVRHPGRALDAPKLLEAINRAAGRYAG